MCGPSCTCTSKARKQHCSTWVPCWLHFWPSGSPTASCYWWI
ncbi:hypothetical protein CRUP_012660 [Coryphaenoides rupestris]|nr:hypothetical protein CRUP_012660 [Coryphaenoides rupestris]